MLHIFKTILVGITLVIAAVILAPLSGAQAAEFKLGFVNTAKLLKEAPQAEEASKKLEKEFAPREKEIVGEGDDLTKMEEQYQRDAQIMSESQRRNLERDITNKKRELRRLQSEFREDVNIRRNEEFGKLQRVISEIINDIGKEQSFNIILYEGIAYGDKQNDLTDIVLQRLQKLKK